MLFCSKAPAYLRSHTPTQAPVEAVRLVEFYLCEDLVALSRAGLYVQMDVVQARNPEPRKLRTYVLGGKGLYLDVSPYTFTEI